MNLRELIDYKLDIKKEKLIGRELMIADKPVLLLGLQEVRNEDAYYYRLENGSDSEEDEYITILYILYEDEPEDEDWYDDEIEEPVTRRQLKMEDIETPYQPQVSGVEVFLAGDKSFPVSGMTNGQVWEFFSYHQGHMISSAAKAGVIPDNWLDIDEQRLWCCEYRLDSEAFGAEWNDKECSIDVIMEKPDIEIFVGKKFQMHPGNDQEPIAITITDPKGQLAEVVVHGLHVEVFPGWPDEEEEEIILAIEYEAPENLQMNFFRTDYLDAEQPDNEGGIFAMISDNQNSNVRYDYLGLVPDGFDETIEIELFSYYSFEQDEENDKASDTERNGQK